MVATVIGYGDAGMAGIARDEFAAATELFSGNTPLPVSEPGAFATAAADIPLFTPVSRDANGLWVIATQGTPAEGVTAAPVLAGATDKSCPVFTSGCLNPAAINWPVSYNTDAKKMAAFRDAPTPTNIVLKKHLYQGITSNPVAS